MTTTVTCIACKHWSLRDAPAMAPHGFGVCQQSKTPHTTFSADYPRICIRFAPLPQGKVQERIQWIKKRSKT